MKHKNIMSVEDTFDVDALIAGVRRKEAKAYAEIDYLIRKASSGLTIRFCRALIYTFAAYLLTFMQDVLDVGAGLAFIVFLLALPRRSSILSEITLGVLLFLALLPAPWEQIVRNAAS